MILHRIHLTPHRAEHCLLSLYSIHLHPHTQCDAILWFRMECLPIQLDVAALEDHSVATDATARGDVSTWITV